MYRIVLLTWCLLLLSGCGLLKPKEIVVTKYRYVKIPITGLLKKPCLVKPIPSTITNKTITKYMLSQMYELERCEEKRKALVDIIRRYNENIVD